MRKEGYWLYLLHQNNHSRGCGQMHTSTDCNPLLFPLASPDRSPCSVLGADLHRPRLHFAAAPPSKQGRCQPTTPGYSLQLVNYLEIVGAVKPAYTQLWANSRVGEVREGQGTVTDILTRTWGPCKWKGSSANKQKKGNGEWARPRPWALQATIFRILIFCFTDRKLKIWTVS